MKQVVLDTHALVWYLTSPKKLGKKAKQFLRLAEGGHVEVLIPLAVGWELVLLRETGRRVIGLAEVNELLVAKPVFRWLLPDVSQLEEFSWLGPIRDSFDRFVVAAARSLRCPLMTADAVITESRLVDVMWD